MRTPVPIVIDPDLTRAIPADEDAGFGSLATDKGHLPLKAMDVHADLDGLLARVTLKQTFVNSVGEPLEATYIFPLPDRAAVTSFRMEVAGRVIDGVLKERGEARREYDEALQAGRRAAITEEERPGVFTLRVGNLMPGEEAVVRLTLTGPLPYRDGEATFRFPLVVAPRYIPGKPLPGPSVGEGYAADTDAVPDASRITPLVLLPGYPHPVRLALTVDVHPGALPLRDFRSSLHAVAEEERGRTRRITVQPGERLDRDFILRFRVAEDSIVTSLSLHPDADDAKAGTFLLTLVPPAASAKSTRPRDVAFVLDRSGSMGGWKMVAARRALARMVDTLTERDRFAVYAFDERIETPPGLPDAGLADATNRNRYRAVEFLARVEARGGTEMAAPLDRAVRALASSTADRERVLVLVTDGQVGNEDQLLRQLAPHVAGLRVFTLGIDQAVNAAFLRRLAALGGGLCELVESEDQLDEVMDTLHRRLEAPVLTGLRLEPAGLRFEPDTLVPARASDLFAGAPLFVLGRYRGESKGSIALQATDAAGRMWSQTVTAMADGHEAVPPVWARGHLRELEDQYAAGRGDQQALAKRIVEVSLKYGVLCRFTAFVAVDRSEIANAGGQQHRIVQPVEPAAGWEMLGTGGMGAVFAASLPAYMHSRAMVESVDSMLALPPTPAALAGKARTRHAGLLHQLLSPQEPRQPEPPEDVVDLSVYRHRAAELLDQLRGDPHPDLTGRLAMLAVRLAQLVLDLKSVGAAASDVGPLEQLLDKLQRYVGSKRQDTAERAALWAESETVLHAFASGAAAPAGPDRRKDFWK